MWPAAVLAANCSVNHAITANVQASTCYCFKLHVRVRVGITPARGMFLTCCRQQVTVHAWYAH